MLPDFLCLPKRLVRRCGSKLEGMRKNLFSSQTATSKEVIAKGFRSLLNEAALLGVKTVWLVSHQKSNLDGHISDTLGVAACKALASGKTVRVGDVAVQFYGERTLPYQGDGSPVLACFPSEKLLDELDGKKNIPCLIVLPWNAKDAAKWISAHGPADIFGSVNTQKLSVSNAVVEKALESLWALINVKAGISHPSDKQSAIDIFRILQAGRQPYAPEEVRAWLVQKGMRPEHANQIAEIATNPSGFRTKAPSVLPPDLLERWKKQAAGEE